MRREFNVLSLLRRTFNADLAALSRLDLRAGFFSHIVASEASPIPESFETPFVPSTCCAVVVSQSRPIIINGIIEDDNFPQCPMMKAEGFSAYLGVPIYVNNRVVGALEAVCKNPKDWTPIDLKKMTRFARSVEPHLPIGHSRFSLPNLRLMD